MRLRTAFPLIPALVWALVACGGRPAPTRTVSPTAAPTAAATSPEPTATFRPPLTATAQPSPQPSATTRTLPASMAPQVAAGAVKFEQGACPFDVAAGADVKCGYVAVPEDHYNASGPTIRLAVGVFRSEGGAPRPDPVILLAGGPGEKVMAEAPRIAAQLSPMIGERDLIVFDQRGVGLSKPALECPEFVQKNYELLDETDPDIASRESYESLAACRDRLMSQGINLSLYSTVQNAADVEALRIALGYQRLNLLGASYGTLLAQAVMRDQPQGVRSVVVASVLPLEKSFFVDLSTTAARAITRLLGACAADSACDAVYPDLEDVLFATIDQLNAKPVSITVTNPIDGKSYPAELTGDALFGHLAALLYRTELIPILPRAIYNVSRGEYALMAQLFGVTIASFDAVSRGMEFSVLCADDLIGRTEQEYLDNLAALPKQLTQDKPETVAKYGPFAGCRMWGVKQASPTVKRPLVSDIPTLILEGEFDPVTPPEYGQLVARNLRNSYFYSFPTAGHNVILTVECAGQVARAFFDNPTAAPDAACVKSMPGLRFDVAPKQAELVLEPIINEDQGFRSVAPGGWKEFAPGSVQRGATMLDQTALVQQAVPAPADRLLSELMRQFKVDPTPEPVSHEQVGAFTWDFYQFTVQGYASHLALAEEGGVTYMVFLVCDPPESEELYEKVFLPAVRAMARLE